ncbi:hypothetical protein [Dechloromonas agitata]|uniref:hypothetical protein n=1 Tax=Dechloromonas agitata TaxID=73030 RepID=UPI0012FCBAA8|nr:hypothetical protein [Dechloromonas agitata]
MLAEVTNYVDNYSRVMTFGAILFAAGMIALLAHISAGFFDGISKMVFGLGLVAAAVFAAGLWFIF